jgi:hypothetical protein
MLGERKLDGSQEKGHWRRRKVGIFYSITGVDFADPEQQKASESNIRLVRCQKIQCNIRKDLNRSIMHSVREWKKGSNFLSSWSQTISGSILIS